MGAGPDGLDQSWGYADPKQAAAAGIKVVSMYLSHDPSKNVTAAKVKAYHRAGIGVLLNWESDAGRPLLGGSAGRADATEAARQAKQLISEVGYPPGDVLCIYFSCDRDVTAAQIAGPVADYFKAAGPIVRKVGGWTFKWGVFPRRRFRLGVYGEADVVRHLAAHKITDAEWQTYAWSGGRLDPAADFYQYLNGQRLAGASVDFNHIVHADQLGAWWPPGHEPDTAKPNPEEFTVDKEAAARFDALEAKLAKIPDEVWLDKVGSGQPWTVLTQGLDATKRQSAAAQLLVTELGKRVAALQAANAAQSQQIAALVQQVADLASGKVNVSGSIPATLTIGSQS
jgi:hypothetical protein